MYPDIEVECAECGALFSIPCQSKITLEPCSLCLKRAREAGAEEGWDEGYEAAKEDCLC